MQVRVGQLGHIKKILGGAKPAKDNYLELRYTPSTKKQFTARLWRKGKPTAGFVGESAADAVDLLLKDVAGG